jgi:mRNA interferase MazF
MVRGEVFRLARPRDQRGREQADGRYAVVVQADELLGLSTVLVAPTSTSALATTFRPSIRLLDAETRVLADQTRAVDPQRLGKSVGRLDPQELGAVDEALALVLGL